MASDRLPAGSDGTWHIVENWYWHECMGGGGPAKSKQAFRTKAEADRYLAYPRLRDDPERGMSLAQFPSIHVGSRKSRTVTVRNGKLEGIDGNCASDHMLIANFMERQQRTERQLTQAREQKEAALQRRAMKAYKNKASSDDALGDILAYEEMSEKKKKKKKSKSKGTATAAKGHRGGGEPGVDVNRSFGAHQTPPPQLRRELSERGRACLNKALG
eukprot:CAMPEP_0205920156 /NCGR_PEP_ID=MMETSP1325-20131115/10890_1 /ASSEMBLY_ACC=CAM_ASM_000708 /TAXON_ID=236786 /ORGANISM="Florenciella sp., Strain RCC1007" /LENGTH=215 /DNA_ID=CAMNT_0053287823 /DNA_START=68 /DNA_END=715 /DNA_ORIENTATION=+